MSRRIGGHVADAHGGGFVFDCRCLPNPGRLDIYAARTGIDADVAMWLKQQPSVEEFLESIRSLLEFSLIRYDERGFTDLTVSFGCTGGRHRSVYCAERCKQLLTARGLRVRVRHLELEAATDLGA